MKHKFLSLALFTFLSTTVAAQTPTPSPTPEDDGDVVKISTSIIQLDVSVTDRKGRVITDLKKDEIQVFSNGKKQDVEGFSFVSDVRESAGERPAPAAIPGMPPKPLRIENVRRTIAVVVDDLSLSFTSTFRVRTALKKFIEREMRDGDMVAIIRTGAGIGALQQFTNDRRQLLMAIDRLKWNPMGLGGLGSFEQVRGGINRDLRTGAPDDDPNAANDEDLNEFRRNVFSTGTLGAIKYVVRGMSELPGRKSIMLLSDGIRLFYRRSDGMMESSNVLEPLRLLIDQANRSSVVINTMDARGLETTGITAADSVGEMTEEERVNIEDERRQQLLDTQDGLRFLARQTGGTAVVNNNDLVGGLRKILDDQSYYLISYEPDQSTFNPKLRRFHNIDIKVTRPGARVRYRKGFYGIPDESLARDTRNSAERLASALTSPFGVNEVSLRLNALFVGSRTGSGAIRSLLHIPVKDIRFTDLPDGNKQAKFDVIAIAFGENGQAVEQESKEHTLSITKEAFERSLARGFVYDFAFAIKKPGPYQLRVALRDHGSDRVGSANQFVEVPNLKKKRLAASDIFLEGLTPDAFNARVKGAPVTEVSRSLVDTALRRFNVGSVLNFGMAIYNAKASAGQPGNLTAQVRILRDGVSVFEGAPRPVSAANVSDVQYGSSIALAKSMVAGDYVLQVTITDNLAGKKKNTVTRFVPFELVADGRTQ